MRREGTSWNYDGGSSSEGALITVGVTEASAVGPGASALDGESLGALDVRTEAS